MKLYYWISLCLCIIIISCKKTIYYAPDEIKYVNTQNIHDSLEAKILPISVFVPQQIAFIDSFLIILTKNPSEFISIVNTQNDSLIANFCVEGRGPNEYLVPYTLKQFDSNKAGDRLLYITDNYNVVKAFNITQSIYKNEAVCEPAIPINTSTADPFFLAQGATFLKQHVTYNDPRDYIFFPPSYIIKNNSNTKKYHIFPDILKNPTVRALPLFLYDAVTRIKPDLTKIVDAMSYLDNLNIIETSSGKCLGITEQNSCPFEDLVYSNEGELLKRLKYGVLDICVTNEHIIMLYDGRFADAVEKQTEELKPILKIFNWEGDFLCAYQLSEPLRGIAYDENHKTLYGFDMKENFYKYLPPN